MKGGKDKKKLKNRHFFGGTPPPVERCEGFKSEGFFLLWHKNFPDFFGEYYEDLFTKKKILAVLCSPWSDYVHPMDVITLNRSNISKFEKITAISSQRSGPSEFHLIEIRETVQSSDQRKQLNLEEERSFPTSGAIWRLEKAPTRHKWPERTSREKESGFRITSHPPAAIDAVGAVPFGRSVVHPSNQLEQ